MSKFKLAVSMLLILAFALYWYESDNKIVRTPIHPIVNSDATTDYTLLDRKSTGYRTNELGEYSPIRKPRENEWPRLSYRSILRLPSDMAVRLPFVFYEADKKAGKKELTSIDNAYIDLFFSLTDFSPIKKSQIREFFELDTNKFLSNDVLLVRVHGQYYDPRYYNSELKRVYEEGCEKDREIKNNIFILKTREKNRKDSKKYFLCDQYLDISNKYSFYNDKNEIIGGGSCFFSRNCSLDFWINGNRNLTYTFKSSNFEKFERIDAFAKQFVDQHLHIDWDDRG